MAASRMHSSFRHDGHIFFIYDHRVKTEEDDPTEAILYFYPASVTTDQQIAIVGGIIGISDFCLEFLPQAMPHIVKLCGHSFALLQHEEFIIGLGGTSDIPDNFLIEHIRFVWSTFILYQSSLGAIKERVSDVNFRKEITRIWDMYLPLCQLHSDPLSQAFKVLPYVQLHKSQGSLYLHAAHILQRTLRYKGVVAGALFSWKKVLCSHLSNSLTRQLLLLMTQSQFPCVEANSILELPGGVRLLHVFLPEHEYERLSHRRRKMYRSSPHALSADGVLDWAGLVTPSASQQSSMTRLDVGGVGLPTSTSLYQSVAASTESQAGSEAYSTVSESASRSGSRSFWPAGGVASGTDSEVFLDTLTEANFDKGQQPTVAELKEEARHLAAMEPPFNPERSRNSPFFLVSGASGNTSSSEQNSPEQKNLLVFADVHVNAATNDSTPDVIPEYIETAGISQKDSVQKKQSISEEILVFGQHSNKLKDEKASLRPPGSVGESSASAGLNQHAFLSISNLKGSLTPGSPGKENPNSSFKPKVVETIVDFIYPNSGQKKSQVVSKTVLPNGVVPSATSEEHMNEPCNSNVKVNGRTWCSEESQSGGLERDSGGSSVQNEDTSLTFHEQHPSSEKLVKNSGVEIRNTHPDDLAETKPVHDPSTPEYLMNCTSKEPSEAHCQDALSAQTSSIKKGQNISSSLNENSLSSQTEENQNISMSQEAEEKNEFEVNRKTTQVVSCDSSNEGRGVSQGMETSVEGKAVLAPQGDRSFSSQHQTENESNVQRAVAQSKHEIDASLEAGLSGDESSPHSSSEQQRQPRLSMDSSTLSLAEGDLSSSKIRLMFEPSESDNSDAGIMSPLSETGRMPGSDGRLSPVDETKNHLSGNQSFGEDENEEEDGYAARRFSSEFDRRQGSSRGSSRNSQGRKSTDSSGLLESQSPSLVAAGSTTTEGPDETTSAEGGRAGWSPDDSRLHKMTLYAQGHSDTLLVLLLSRQASCSKSYINSLWKTCLSHLAELDFEVKDAERHMKDDSENIGAAYQYMRYDSFSQSLKGSALLPVSSLANEIVDSCIKMHDTFEKMPDVQDITYRSHSACCYGHRAINTETYFQLGQPRNAAGICAQNDRTFSLEQLGGRILHNDTKISIL